MSSFSVSLKAKLNIFGNRTVYLSKVITGNGSEQFVDEFDNIWYINELSNIEHFKTIQN